MRKTTRFLEILSIHPGEGARVSGLLLYSMGNGLYMAFFFSAANALFLKQFDAEMLPWAYIASALLGYFAVDAVARLQKKLPFQRLSLWMLLFLLAVVVAGWAAHLAFPGEGWVSFTMYLTVNACFALTNIGFWGLATRLLDLRQSKRLFGLVSTGEVVMSIFGFFMVPTLIRYLGDTVHLLVLSMVGAVISMAATSVIARSFRAEVSLAADGDVKRSGAFSELLRNRYFVWMGALIAALTFTFFLVDLGFLTEVRAAHTVDGAVATARLAGFFGLFFGSVRIIELVAKLFLTGRSINALGIRFSLILLPACLFLVLSLACLAEAAARAGGSVQAHALFFYLVLLGKLVWTVLRKALFDSAFGVLYQPLPSERRLLFQTKISSLGQVCALTIGVILVLASRRGFDAFYVLAFALPVLVAWILIVIRVHKEYRARLMGNLTAVVASGAARSPAEMIAEQVRGCPPEDLHFYLRMLECVDPTAVEPLLEERLKDVLPQVRAGILERIERRRAFGTIEAVARCLRDAIPPWLREVAERTLASLTELRDLAGDPERLAALARSDDPAQRELAATALGWAPPVGGLEELSELISDRNWRVRQAAIVAAGRLGHPRFWGQIVGYLAVPELADAATFALITIGEGVLPELELASRRVEQALEVKLRILAIYERIGGHQVRVLLRDKLFDPDKAVRIQALRILSVIGLDEGADLAAPIVHEIEKTVGAVVWDFTALRDLGEGPATVGVREALEGEIDQCRSAIFMLLSLVYDPSAVKLIRESIESSEEEATVYALEILDLLISPELKPLVFPVLEELPPSQALRSVGRFYPEERMNRSERLNAIIHRQHARMGSWTKACAIRVLGQLSDKVPDMLVAMLFHPEPMLRELAAQKIYGLSPEDFARHVAKLRYEDRERIQRVVATDGSENGDATSSLFDKVARLSRTHGFSGLTWDLLLRLAENAEDVTLEPGAQVPLEGDPEGTLYVVVKGFLAPAGVGPGAVSGTRSVSARSVIVARALTASVRAMGECRVLRLDGERLFGLVADYAELLPAMMRVVRRPSMLTHGTMATRYTDAGTFRTIF